MVSTSRVPANWFGLIRSKNDSYLTLREMRIQAGFVTAKEFAAHAGILYLTYTMIEKGTRTAGISLQKRIATGLGMAVEEVFPERSIKPTQIKVTRVDKEILEAQLRSQFGAKLITIGECVR
ncbi:helix-turn-helix transcriptional regulator [Anaerosinus massiliensis]|uniref:helix-turn-helix transcriptional regulator n=1 Tax=Massilibacillus massiliensis TaxID=1806837 RepID=UPI000DA62C77|nr:helix-turn-helix transcriptional regulator [Massilibacillus massiliensis]